MRVIGLQAQNFKILKAIDIRPGDGPVIIGGNNEQGKSSVMDAIWVALAGRSVAPPKPIRKGEEECRIQLTVGEGEAVEYVVQRKFTAKEGGTYTDSIKVLDDRGRIVPGPQAVLDNLLGGIGFDPFAFTKLKPEDQATQLLQLVPLPIDLEEFAEEDRRDYATRTARNRDAETLAGQLQGLAHYEDAPAEPVDREAIVQQLATAAETNGQLAAEQREREDTARVAGERRAHGEELRTRAAALRAEADRLDASAKADDADAERLEKVLAALPALAAPVNTEDLRTKLAEAEATNAKVDANRRRAEVEERRKALVAESEALTAAMEGRKEQRRAALQKAKMPVEGLGFAVNEKGKAVVTFDDLPFEQASTAQQIKASTAIAMAANPELRILRIKDGSLLDANTMKMVADMAAEQDFQLWVEIVGEGAAGIIIEAGAVKSAEPPAEGGEPKKKAAPKKAKPEAPADGKML